MFFLLCFFSSLVSCSWHISKCKEAISTRIANSSCKIFHSHSLYQPFLFPVPLACVGHSVTSIGIIALDRFTIYSLTHTHTDQSIVPVALPLRFIAVDPLGYKETFHLLPLSLSSTTTCIILYRKRLNDTFIHDLNLHFSLWSTYKVQWHPFIFHSPPELVTSLSPFFIYTSIELDESARLYLLASVSID